MRGRRPRPTKLTVLKGNPGKRALNEDEPQPPVTDDELQAPDWLDPRAQAEWERIVPIMRDLGVMTDVDIGVMAGYCQAYSTLQDAVLQMQNFGLVYQPTKGKNYLQQTPFLSIANKAMSQMRKLAAELGLTPSSRSRIKADTGGPKSNKRTGMGKFFAEN
jgi:P27 family predicted phage terminase small subunit